MLLKSVVWVHCAFAGLAARDEDGQTLVEYALIVGIISIALIATLGFLRDDIVALFKTITDAI
jgi:pilus assembly protein Flp/PilA